MRLRVALFLLLTSIATAAVVTANRWEALANNTSGNNNVAIGSTAGSNLTTGNYNIDIGADVVGLGADANTIRIGRGQKATFVAGIYAVPVRGSPVVVNSNGKLGVAASSARFKDDIQPMDKASEPLLKLKPVTFRYKQELDPEKIPQFGLIAEEVAKVDPDLVVRDEDGKLMSVRYEAVNAMLLNEFLKEHQKVEKQGRELQEQKSINADLRSALAAVNQRLKQQDARIDKVNAKVELTKPSPQVVESR